MKLKFISGLVQNESEMSLLPLFRKKSEFHISAPQKSNWMAFFIDSSCILESSEGFKFYRSRQNIVILCAELLHWCTG